MRAKREHRTEDDAKSKAEQRMERRTSWEAPGSSTTETKPATPRAGLPRGDTASPDIHKILPDNWMLLQHYFRFLYVFLSSSAPGMLRGSAPHCWGLSKWEISAPAHYWWVVSLAEIFRSQDTWMMQVLQGLPQWARGCW